MKKVKRNAREEDARITAAAQSDPDNPPLTDEQLARLRPASETHGRVVERYRRTRGAQKAPTKKQVTLRLDQEVIEHYRKTGEGWQTRINDDLRLLLNK